MPHHLFYPGQLSRVHVFESDQVMCFGSFLFLFNTSSSHGGVPPCCGRSGTCSRTALQGEAAPLPPCCCVSQAQASARCSSIKAVPKTCKSLSRTALPFYILIPGGFLVPQDWGGIPQVVEQPPIISTLQLLPGKPSRNVHRAPCKASCPLTTES